jgi:hypothetical protein
VNHHEEAIDEAILTSHGRHSFVSLKCGRWIVTFHIPNASTYYSVTTTGELYLNCPDDPKPIRISTGK